VYVDKIIIFLFYWNLTFVRGRQGERKAGSSSEARIVFQPRQRDKPGVWGRAPSGVQGQIPWSGGQMAKPPEAESFSVVGWPKEMENLFQFSYFTTYSLFSKCCGDLLFLHDTSSLI